jgi:glycyl-tRNA synthetase (class II)
LKNPLLMRAAQLLPPETTQDHFLNFARLLEHNNGRVPFASSDTRSGQP